MGIEWIGWETRMTQKYLIRHEGKFYPPKMIISLATGLPRSEFNGGSQSIRYLAKYNVRVEPIAGRFQDQVPAMGIANKGQEDSMLNNGFEKGLEKESKALILIPCCKSKAAVFSEYWSAPFPELKRLRKGMLDKINETEVLIQKDDNLSGILNPHAHLTRALDLYVGNFYYVAGSSLEQVAAGSIPAVDVLIVSAFYGLVLLNERVKKYELQMSDRLQDGTKVYKYWQTNGLAHILADYVGKNKIKVVWSLLPNSMPSFPYQQVFQTFWEEAEDAGIACYHVNVPGAGSSSGYQRAKWLKAVMELDPDLLLDGNRMPSSFDLIPGYTFKYVSCAVH